MLFKLLENKDNSKAFMSGGHKCNLLLTASYPPACTNAVLAAVLL